MGLVDIINKADQAVLGVHQKVADVWWNVTGETKYALSNYAYSLSVAPLIVTAAKYFLERDYLTSGLVAVVGALFLFSSSQEIRDNGELQERELSALENSVVDPYVYSKCHTRSQTQRRVNLFCSLTTLTLMFPELNAGIPHLYYCSIATYFCLTAAAEYFRACDFHKPQKDKLKERLKSMFAFRKQEKVPTKSYA